MARDVIIFDTTLRDGEQAPGNAMSPEAKLRLARQLDTLGVDVLEAGFPAASQGDLRGVQQVAEAVTLVGSRTRAKDGMSLFQYFFDDCDVVFADEGLLRSAMSHWLRYDGRLSVPDCVTVEVMSRRGISRLLSFDSDFDRVRGVDRVH